jgi:dimethylhistidine N-methyltransferase
VSPWTLPSASVDRSDAAETAQFAADVHYYLRQEPRQLPSRYLYDALGSSLFEAICRLPWYRVTRAEEQLLRRHAADVLGSVRPSMIAELGPGSGEKVRIVIAAREPAAADVDLHLIDVSSSALDTSARALQSFDGVHIRAHLAAYEEGLQRVGLSRAVDDRVLVLFLGSNIGNYDPPGANAFLRGVRAQLGSGDALLLGVDLVKSEPELLLAYDDPLGITAAFNRNLLVRINRELGGDFDVTQFAHRAVWNAGESRVEMHLVARSLQSIQVPKADVAFTMAEGDRIWTESSYKYQPDGVGSLLERAGFSVRAQWLDAADRFALTLAEAV